jgi:magnesium transporter
VRDAAAREDEHDATGVSESVVDVQPQLVETVVDALDADDGARVRDTIAPLHDADLADLLQNLGSEHRRKLVRVIRSDFRPDVLAELDETIREDVIAELGILETAAAVADMDTDDALLVIADLGEDDKKAVLQAMPLSDRTLIEQQLTYAEFSAGRLMQRELVALPGFWTIGETIDYLRRAAESESASLPGDFYDLFVIDPVHRPMGVVPLSRLLTRGRITPLSEIMNTEMKVITTSTDQEDVAFLFRQRNLTSAPVVDDGGRLVGVITIDDVVDVIDQEHEDDLMHLGGVGTDDFYRRSIGTAGSRFPWLAVNLGTAFLASLVIAMFETTIEKVVALAVLMPIVASMGGNAGTQTLTVAVRALATKELTTANALRTVGKESLVGLFNGVLFAAITGIIAWLWFGSSKLALVLALAMIANLLVAGLSGATIPLLLHRLKVDPAVSSAVFLTTVTDVIGFFAFLGLATLLLF